MNRVLAFTFLAVSFASASLLGGRPLGSFFGRQQENEGLRNVVIKQEYNLDVRTNVLINMEGL